VTKRGTAFSHAYAGLRSAGTQLRFGVGLEGIERMEASFAEGGFAPHRHDRYAIGITLSGVQSFRYRGSQHAGLPGEGHILHPDELHDGVSGNEEGLRDRILYIDPALIQQAARSRTLPFVAEPVVTREAVDRTLLSSLRDLSEPLTELQGVELITAIADTLEKNSSLRSGREGAPAVEAVSLVRELIIDDPVMLHPAAELETISGLTRWEVARQFRAAFGTSPTQFRTMRQLDLARGLLRNGVAPATVATEVGFADQSHLSRMFRRAYGITPAAWASATRATADSGHPEHRGRSLAQPFNTSASGGL
jgi:AraC-like DNA-binding protein